MKTSDIVEYIKNLDRSSPDFYEIYSAASDKYWIIENPDEFQQKAISLHHLAEQGEPWFVHAVATLAENLFKIIEEHGGLIHTSFEIEDLPIFVTMCTDPEEMDKLMEVLEKHLMSSVQRKPGEEVH